MKYKVLTQSEVIKNLEVNKGEDINISCNLSGNIYAYSFTSINKIWNAWIILIRPGYDMV